MQLLRLLTMPACRSDFPITRDAARSMAMRHRQFTPLCVTSWSARVAQPSHTAELGASCATWPARCGVARRGVDAARCAAAVRAFTLGRPLVACGVLCPRGAVWHACTHRAARHHAWPRAGTASSAARRRPSASEDATRRALAGTSLCGTHTAGARLLQSCGSANTRRCGSEGRFAL